MKRRRERVIGLVMTRADTFHRQILRGVAEFANLHPESRFVMAPAEIGRPVQELLRNVDAAIVGVYTAAWCRLAIRSRARIVNIDCVVPDLPIPRVGVDNRIVGQLAARHFLERGLRSFAYVGQRDFLYSVERHRGFRDALAASGRTLQSYESQTVDEFDLTGCARLLDAGGGDWLQSLTPPCGILTANDALGAEVVASCIDLGIRVPEELAVLGVDDDDLFCRIARPHLSSIILPAEQIGFTAASEAVQLLQGRRRAMRQDILIPPRGIAVRRSTETLAMSDPEVVAAIHFVRENFHRPISMPDVLRVTSLSRRTLERRVFEALGTSVGVELRRARVESAKRLLADSDLPITDVARRSGFSDLRHLTVTFRRDLGQTPTQYRLEASRRRNSGPGVFLSSSAMNSLLAGQSGANTRDVDDPGHDAYRRRD